MSEEMKQQIIMQAREEGYTEEQIKKMLESGDLIFGSLL